MQEYLSPGVYVEEIDTGNKPIEGVATSTVGFLGVAERGPRTPMLLASFTEYTRMFGSYNGPSFLTYSVEGFFQNGGKRCFVARVAAQNAAAANVATSNLTVTALGPGTWANKRVYVKITDCGLNNPADPNTTKLFKLTVIYWDASVNLPPSPMPPVDPTDLTKLTDPNRREPTIIQQYDNLSPEPLSTSFCERMVNNVSVLVTIALNGATRPVNTNALQPLDNGTPGAAITLSDFKGDPNAAPGQRTGLLAVEEIDEVAILCCPDEYYPQIPPGQIAGAMVDQCERLKDRFAILQAQNAAGLINNLRPTQVTKYAAFYYPWIKITDPTDRPADRSSARRPRCRHLRAQRQRARRAQGAGERGHPRPLHRSERSDRRPAVQHHQGRAGHPQSARRQRAARLPGPRHPGVGRAHAAQLDPDWKYVNVRRLFIFVEESIDEATQWVVFEPNDEPTVGARAPQRERLPDAPVEGRDAAGRDRPQEAFFVRCDRTTMTQADIDNGSLIMLIGIAPVKPAEFVIFRIGQWTGGSEVSEG